jgi:hypothetical protein
MKKFKRVGLRGGAMELNETAESRSGLARLLLAVGLMVVAIRSLRKQKRLVAAVAGVGAIVIGYTAKVGSGQSTPDVATEMSRIETTSERGGLRCAVCGEPIVAGEGRGPNEDHEIVHDTCEA